MLWERVFVLRPIDSCLILDLEAPSKYAPGVRVEIAEVVEEYSSFADLIHEPMLCRTIVPSAIGDGVVRTAYLQTDDEFLYEALSCRECGEKGNAIHIIDRILVIVFHLDLVRSSWDELGTEVSRCGASGVVKLYKLVLIGGVAACCRASNHPVVNIYIEPALADGIRHLVTVSDGGGCRGVLNHPTGCLA